MYPFFYIISGGVWMKEVAIMQENVLRTSDGIGLFTRCWQPEGSPRGIVTLVHGIGEHCGRYQHVAEAFNSRGYIFNSFDLRGHGKSEGKRGFTPSYECIMSDIALVISDISSKHPGLSHILYGHSMGGNLALNYLIRYASKNDHQPKLDAVIATSPWLGLANPPGGFIKLFAHIMSAVAPSFQMSNKIDAGLLCHVQEVVEKYASDELVHDKITPMLFVEIDRASKWALEHAEEIRLPCLLMQGQKDGIVSPAASAEFARAAGDLCTYKEWEGLYHEIHNEEASHEVIDFILEWLENTVQR
jgi:alpha-beta hydrolase superfamily lysophospholipase